MAEEHFTLTYEGPALEGGRMSVGELAPALIALSEALQAAQLLAYPDETPAALDIRATREGSFTIDLLLTDMPSIVEQAVTLFAGRHMTAALNLGSVLGYVWGAVELIRLLRTRRVRSQEPLTSGEVRITFDDGSTLQLAEPAVRLVQDLDFRQAIQRTVAPLHRKGVEDLLIVQGDQTVLKVSKQDAAAFDVPAVPNEVLLDEEREVNLTPLNVAFQEGNKWRVTDGQQPFYATLSDQQFVTKIMNNELRFGRNDILRVVLHTRQYRTTDGLSTDHVIVRVLEHLRGPQAVPLPFELPNSHGRHDADTEPTDRDTHGRDNDDFDAKGMGKPSKDWDNDSPRARTGSDAIGDDPNNLEA